MNTYEKIEEQFGKEIADEYVAEWKNYCEVNGVHEALEEVDSTSAFPWSGTERGLPFWLDVSRKIGECPW